MLFDRCYKVFLPPQFYILYENHDSGNHAFLQGFIRDSGGCDVAFVKKRVPCFAILETMLFDRFHKVFLPPQFLHFVQKHGFGDHAFLTGFIRDSGGCDVAFARETVPCCTVLETMLFRLVL